jgi:hypothetical protein
VQLDAMLEIREHKPNGDISWATTYRGSTHLVELRMQIRTFAEQAGKRGYDATALLFGKRVDARLQHVDLVAQPLALSEQLRFGGDDGLKPRNALMRRNMAVRHATRSHIDGRMSGDGTSSLHQPTLPILTNVLAIPPAPSRSTRATATLLRPRA